MSSTGPAKPGDGFLGWLGRQIGYVSKAVKTNVNLPITPAEVVLHRDITVVQHPMPDRPDVLLRRTTIDEAVVDLSITPESFQHPTDG